MGAGCCGGYEGAKYAPSLESGIARYGAAQEYSMRPGTSKRLDGGHHTFDPTAHMHNLYRPKSEMPYTRPEDGHTSARLAQAAERLASPEAKYGAGMARTLYWNVSGI